MPPGHSLPGPIDPSLIAALLASLSLPPATSITPLKVAAAFHTIYQIEYPPPWPPLILRISGPHVPSIKTTNEVAIMAWLRRNTSIPVPRVLHHDSTPNNPLAHEYTLMHRIPGHSVQSMYPALSEATKLKLVNQLIDVLVELNAHAWNHIGGLRLGDGDDILPGPLLEDTFWFLPDIESEFGADESVDTLNPIGPYGSHADFAKGYLAVFVHAIEIHDSLAWMRDLLPRLRGLVDELPALELDTKLVLAHKDLHFANVMATADGDVTGILDWEFAGIVPALRWDPVRAFLFNGDYSQEGHDEKMRLRGIFEKELDKRGIARWWEEGLTRDMEHVWDVIRFTRAIVEVCPRRQKEAESRQWRKSVEDALQKLGV
jgi:hypothetical protein